MRSRYGPSDVSHGVEQIVFASYIRCRKRLFVPVSKIEAQAGPNVLPRGPDGEDDGATDPIRVEYGDEEDEVTTENISTTRTGMHRVRHRIIGAPCS